MPYQTKTVNEASFLLDVNYWRILQLIHQERLTARRYPMIEGGIKTRFVIFIDNKFKQELNYRQKGEAYKYLPLSHKKRLFYENKQKITQS